MAADSYFSFEEGSHTYRLGSVVIPSVTQVLGDIFKTYYPPGPSRVRGRQVHKACELADLNLIEQYDIGEGLMGYVTAWRAVSHEFGWTWEPDEIERRAYDPIKLVAGTPDRVRMDPPLIVDIKSGAASREAALQLAAYVDMKFPDNQGIVERCTVEIHGDGTFSPPVWYRDWLDFLAWRGAVALWQWQNKKR